MNDYLDDIGLYQVLSWLPLCDRLRSERVCRRWMVSMPYDKDRAFQLSQLRWPSRHASDFTYTVNNLTYTQRVMANRRFVRYLQLLLARFGPSLRRLKLADWHEFRVLITGDLLDLLIDWAPNLEILNLGGAIIYVDALHKLKDMPNLQSINLSSCHFLSERTNQPPESYNQLTEIVTELMSHGAITDINLQQFPGIPVVRPGFNQINSLKLNNVTTLTNDTLAELCKTCPDLQCLCVGDCRELSQFAPVAKLIKLKVLSLNGTKITNADFKSICTNCTLLEKLRIDNCPNVTVFSGLKHLTRLSFLWMGPAANFGDGELGRVCRHGQLTDLAISACRITDNGIRYLASHCPYLTQIHASSTQITDEGIKCLLRDCSMLRSMNIQGTNVTDATLANIGCEAKALQLCFLQNCRDISEHGFSALLYERGRRLYNGDRLPQLLVMAGGELGQPISDTVVDQLRYVGVTLEVKRPVLALAFSP